MMKLIDLIGFKVVDYVESPFGSKKGLIFQKDDEIILINFKELPIEIYELKIRKQTKLDKQ